MEIGDTAEVIAVINGAPNVTIGMQGIVVELCKDDDEYCIRFKEKVHGCKEWFYGEVELRFISKGGDGNNDSQTTYRGITKDATGCRGIRQH